MMRVLSTMVSVIVLSLMISSIGFAKTTPLNKTITSKNSSKFDIRIPMKKMLKKLNNGFRIGIAQGSLDYNLRSRRGLNSGQNFDQSINENSRTKFQIHAGWERVRIKEIGYSTFLTYQDIETKDALEKTESYRNYRVSGNATYGLDKQIYTFGGLNYGAWYGTDEIESSLNAGIGYQLGMGFKFHKRAILELEYLTLRNEGSNSGTNLNLEAKGIMLKLNTPFSFNI